MKERAEAVTILHRSHSRSGSTRSQPNKYQPFRGSHPSQPQRRGGYNYRGRFNPYNKFQQDRTQTARGETASGRQGNIPVNCSNVKI